MPVTRSDAHKPPIAVNIAAGLAGGLIASFVMEKVQGAIEHFSSGTNSSAQGEAATSKAAAAIATRVSGEPIRRASKPVAPSVVQYAFGGALGAAYGAATVDYTGS